MEKLLKRIIFLSLSIAFFTYSLAIASPLTIHTLNVEIESGGSCDIAEPIKKRITKSVLTIGQEVIVGQAVEKIASSKEAYEKLFQDIIGRVLIGYMVDRVEITPDNETAIKLKITPLGDVIQKVEVEANLNTFQPIVREMLKEDLIRLETEMNKLLLGQAVDAMDWAATIIRTKVTDHLDYYLPEFYTTVDIKQGLTTKLNISLIPKSPVVQNATVQVNSDTIPHVLLLGFRERSSNLAEELQGLPVAYVDKHRAVLNNKLLAMVKDDKAIKKYNLNLTLDALPGAETNVYINANTTKYKFWLEGYLNFGTTNEDTSFKGHMGKLISQKDEAYIEVGFVPATINWDISLGIDHELSKKTTNGMKYDFEEDVLFLNLAHKIDKNWSLKLECPTTRSADEKLYIRYKLHEFLSLEYILSNDDKHLRVVGNL